MANNGPGVAQTNNVMNRNELVSAAYPSGIPNVQATGEMYYAGKRAEALVTNPFTGPFGNNFSWGQRQTISGMRPVANANTDFADMPQNDRNEWNKSLSKALGWDISKQPLQSMNYYSQAVAGAAAYTQATGKAITPREWIQKMVPPGATAGGSGGGGGGGGYSGPVTTVSKQKVVNLTNPSEAQMLVDNALTDYLGRNATEEERVQFRKALNQLERENPVVQKSKQTVTPKGAGMQVSSSKSTQRGGVSAAAVAEEFATSRPDAAETVMSGRFMDWFMQKVAQDPMEGLSSGLA